jgi:hypothetical protein
MSRLSGIRQVRHLRLHLRKRGRSNIDEVLHIALQCLLLPAGKVGDRLAGPCDAHSQTLLARGAHRRVEAGFQVPLVVFLRVLDDRGFLPVVELGEEVDEVLCAKSHLDE